MPRLLLVSYVFPPQGGSGPLRRVKLLRYLKELGWETTVLTTTEGFTRQSDTSLLLHVPPETQVVRARSYELSSLNPLVSRIHRSRRDRGTVDGMRGVVPTDSMPTRLARGIQRWVLLPDREVGWLPDAVRHGHRIVREWQPDVIASFSYPFTCHLVGRSLARSYDLPFVTNFSDFWAGNRILFDVLPTAFHRRVGRRLEAAVVRTADVNVVITEGMRREFARRYPDLGADRWAVAYNGFDPDDLANVQEIADPRSSEGPFRLVYTGLAFADRNSSNDPRPLLQGLATLRRGKPDLGNRVVLDIYGTTDAVTVTEIDRLGLEAVVRLRGHVPYAEALAAIASSDATVILMTDREAAESVLPTKIFDYLGLGRPILAVTYEGETAQFARRGRRSVLVSPDDPAAIAAGIESLVNLRHEPLGSIDTGLDRYTREATAGAFDEALTRAIAIHFQRRRLPG